MMNYQTDDKYWVQDVTSGERGWLVGDDPDTCVMPPVPKGTIVRVRLNRPMELLLKPYQPSRWKPLATANPLSNVAKAKVAHAAVRELASAMGDHAYARKEMASMGESERIALAKNGPKAKDPSAANDIRQRLWDAIMEVLGGRE